ncbi:MAG TPA: glutamine--fructose-6-phosphate aminotransferase, partial [Acidimicrobiia bacterium]
MCGIVGYVGPRSAVEVLIPGLARLEYRGYDSAGVALQKDDGIAIVKQAGRIADLERSLARAEVPESNTGIGHTRWATHGVPNTINAHPHRDCTGQVIVVHNG